LYKHIKGGENVGGFLEEVGVLGEAVVEDASGDLGFVVNMQLQLCVCDIKNQG
jgi:hypothetical protein